MFLGYSSSHKGYKCLSSSRRVYISKDALFNELRFPYSDLFSPSSSSTKSLDTYFSLSPSLSPPCVATIPQITQASPANSGSIPLIPLGFHLCPLILPSPLCLYLHHLLLLHPFLLNLKILSPLPFLHPLQRLLLHPSLSQLTLTHTNKI